MENYFAYMFTTSDIILIVRLKHFIIILLLQYQTSLIDLKTFIRL